MSVPPVVAGGPERYGRPVSRRPARYRGWYRPHAARVPARLRAADVSLPRSHTSGAKGRVRMGTHATLQAFYVKSIGQIETRGANSLRRVTKSVSRAVGIEPCAHIS